MGMFWDDDDTKAVGNAVPKITGGLRNLFTGEIPPEILQEMDKLDSEHVSKRWEADSKIPWYLSSRSIVLLWLNFTIILMMFLDGSTSFVLNEVVMTTMLGTLGVVNAAFFGSKGLEYIKAGKAP